MSYKYIISYKFPAVLTLCILEITFVNIIRADNDDCPKYASINEDCNCSECLPGLLCNAAEICVRDTSSCLSHQWTDSLWKPSCEDDGSWSAKQCKGELTNGRCFCYNAKGSRIFGWAWWTDDNNMTCACSRRRDELKGTRDDVSLHCTENGNYEELQCDNGLCWCVEPKTGKPTQRIYPESDMTYLPCYKANDIGSQYLRQCESKHIARSEMLMQLNAHGIEFAHVDDVYCDDDGSFGFYKLVKNIAHCVWKDSSRLELYQGSTSVISSMDCNCARDTRIFHDNGIEMILTCVGNGNYDSSQFDNGRPFCVDEDGFPTTHLGYFGQAIKCPPAIVENKNIFSDNKTTE